MIIATPLDLPNLHIDDWEVFWKIWKQNARTLTKVRQNVATSKLKVGGPSPWKGFDVFRDHHYWETAWEAPFVDISTDLPEFYNQLSNLPFDSVYRVRIITSLVDIVPHTDDNADVWSVRYMLYYTDQQPQWYFTEPGSHSTQQNKKYFKLPPNINWFAYNDKHCYHGTDLNLAHPKLLLQVYVPLHTAYKHLPLVESSIEKYKDYTISI